MFPGNSDDMRFGAPGTPSGGNDPFDGLFEELDDEAMERLILEATEREESQYEFLAVGLQFHAALRGLSAAQR